MCGVAGGSHHRGTEGTEGAEGFCRGAGIAGGGVG